MTRTEINAAIADAFERLAWTDKPEERIGIALLRVAAELRAAEPATPKVETWECYHCDFACAKGRHHDGSYHAICGGTGQHHRSCCTVVSKSAAEPAPSKPRHSESCRYMGDGDFQCGSDCRVTAWEAGQAAEPASKPKPGHFYYVKDVTAIPQPWPEQVAKEVPASEPAPQCVEAGCVKKAGHNGYHWNIDESFRWSTEPAPAPQATDPNVESVRGKLAQRSDTGRAKYGCDTTRSDLSLRDWLNHLQEELMDAAVYVERLLALAATMERKP